LKLSYRLLTEENKGRERQGDKGKECENLPLAKGLKPLDLSMEVFRKFLSPLLPLLSSVTRLPLVFLLAPVRFQVERSNYLKRWCSH
jgi:hypothetical protein